MNKCILMGRLTKDPDVRYTKGDAPKAVGRFSLAVDRWPKREGQPDADFFNCTAFGKQGEFVEKYLKKGTKVIIEGRLQNDNYTNKDGMKVTATGIVLDNIEFCESKKNEQPTEKQKQEWEAIDNLDSEELPFNFG